MQDGSTVRNGYRLDLDSLTVGSRIGMMRCSDGTLHFYLDGTDQGVACTDTPPGKNDYVIGPVLSSKLLSLLQKIYNLSENINVLQLSIAQNMYNFLSAIKLASCKAGHVF